MFLTLASLFQKPESVFRVHPVQLSRWLDEVWTTASRAHILTPAGDFLGILDPRVLDAVDLPTQPAGGVFLAPSGISVVNGLQGQPEWTGAPGPSQLDCPPHLWHHLVYAYLLESTGIVEIFAEVVRRLVVGETLGAISPDSFSWLRATEQMFFGDPPQFSVAAVLSEVRPHQRTNRRNAYWRMFGMDLAHPVPPHWPGATGPLVDWKTQTGPVNDDFRQKWNELLRQVWLGVENRRNGSGPNPADPGHIALLCRAIRDMFADRQRGGALAREGFAYVCMLSWFHLTVDSNTPIVSDLKADASHPANRLITIAKTVGMMPAARSRELFDLAEPMSSILRGIELGLFDTADGAEELFADGSPVAADMINIVNNWQSATGERVKERPTGTVAGGAQPLRVPVPGVPGARAGSAATVPAGGVVPAGANGQGM
jgi:hypothetical protein